MSYNDNKTTTTTTNDSGSAIANGINLEKILADVKECNYNLVNSITATEAIQKEKEALEKELSTTSTIRDEKRIKKLQYNISLQTETLMKTLMKLDSLSITGHIKHSHKIKKEVKKERQLQQQFEDDLDLNTSGDSRNRSESNSTTNTTSSNFSDSDSSDSDSSESNDGSESDSEEYIPKFSPHKLRKYRKQLVNRIMRLIDYLDVLSNETKELKKKYEESIINNTAAYNNNDSNENISFNNNNKNNNNNNNEFSKRSHNNSHYGHQQIPHHQHKGERKQPTVGQNRNSNNNAQQQRNRFTDRFAHQRQSSYDNDSPFEFKEFSNHINNDELYPFGEEEENNFDMDNFESPSSTLNRYRSNSGRDNLPRMFRRF
ncbi:hypothetical protein RB653_006030 [Dictyostelium firmibasis]|uniref:Uncharacterized protein n=1 Tax=Dictyostelium firmibasis TaxID=79012 RepID=A0AAN7YTG5_9MYCE